MDCSQGLVDCMNKSEALGLKIGAIAIILVACVAGVYMPLVGRSFSAFRPESNLFFVMKSFAAGVILATAFVHMLPDSFKALTNSCLAENPWAKFPFAGFISMAAALLTLMIDFWATAYYEKKHAKAEIPEANASTAVNSRVDLDDDDNINSIKLGEIVVDNTHHRHSGDGGSGEKDSRNLLSMVAVHAHASSHAISHAHHGVHPDHHHAIDTHSHMISDDSSQIRHRVISQVLEMGIIAHSIIIGISLGTSESPCTIRPLLAALTFHQFFEGMALGGCIAQAGYKWRASTLMAFFFSITTPSGIAIGIAIASSYNENSPTALIVEGLFDSMSAGILVYMSLVDLIATDFLSKKLQSDFRLQIYSYSALFLGAGAMSIIAYWA